MFSRFSNSSVDVILGVAFPATVWLHPMLMKLKSASSLSEEALE